MSCKSISDTANRANKTSKINFVVYDSSTGRKIRGADLAVYNSSNVLIARGNTDNSGKASLTIKTNDNHYYLVCSAKNYSRFIQTTGLKSGMNEIGVVLMPCTTMLLNKGERRTLVDRTGNVRLRVNADYLKRLDNKPVKFPVKIKLSYINPNKNLGSMPGYKMLSEDPKTKRVMPLTSIGAANIEAYDKENAPVRIKKGTGNATQLFMILATGPVMPSGVKTWEFDKEKGYRTWRSTKQNIRLSLLQRNRYYGNNTEAGSEYRLCQDQAASAAESGYMSEGGPSRIISVKNVNLVPFNLDVPWKGTPVKFFLKRLAGKKMYWVELNIKTSKGNYLTIYPITVKRKPFIPKLLVPSAGKITLNVYIKYKGRKLYTNNFTTPVSKMYYRWKNKFKFTYQPMDGSPMKYKLLGTVILRR